MTIAEQIAELNPDALFFEPREHLDNALVGFTWGPSTRAVVGVYDLDKLRLALEEQFLDDASTQEERELYAESGVLEQDVEEWLSFNLLDTDMGALTPIVIIKGEEK
jgi:hypothetical protein